MNSNQSKVKEFHVAFDIPVLDKPTADPGISAIERRINLITEETLELFEAIGEYNLVGIADGLADLLYIVYGTALEYGIDLEPIFNEVHRSNMSKVGGHKNEFGKWVKPLTYSPANLKPILERQCDAS